ncbi:MAG: hypothetical protein EOP68_20100 [Sphingomonas sp.]|nr:MAG: hypothetical protein EOP68_20100 [Sphingomonas sp.]
MAAAEPEPRPYEAEPGGDTALARAERVAASEPREVLREPGGDTARARAERIAASTPRVVLPEPGGDTSLARTERAAASRPAPVARDRAPAPVYVADDRAPRPRYGDEDRVGQPVYDDRGVDSRPVYAGEDRGMRSGYPDDMRASRPVYAANAYPRDVRPPLGGYGDRGVGPRYAMVERDRLPGASRGDRYADRGGDCDGGRAYRLQMRLRRDVRDGVIDWRDAQDFEDDIGQVDNMHRNYCQSGMTGWREDRLDHEYAQIEDRLRFEEDFNRRD